MSAINRKDANEKLKKFLTRRFSFGVGIAIPLVCLISFVAPASGQEFSSREERQVDIYSEGVRMVGTVFTPADAEDDRLPTILMAHGWGGTAAGLRRDAIVFARNGYLVVTFDYRGWGESDARVMLSEPQRANAQDGRFTAEVREIREIVDPVDMTTDWLNAMHWLHGEPRVDPERIGLWGTSQSGGYVVWAAAHDPRVRAVHSQVGSFDGFGLGTSAEAYQQATLRARGELGYPEPGERVIGNLRGAPILSRFAHYAPVDDIRNIEGVAIQIVLAENEELFDNRYTGILAHSRYQGGLKNLVIIPGISHYGIYQEAREEAQQLALDWFDAHLK